MLGLRDWTCSVEKGLELVCEYEDEQGTWEQAVIVGDGRCRAGMIPPQAF